jgi:hypothetical protein
MFYHLTLQLYNKGHVDTETDNKLHEEKIDFMI